MILNLWKERSHCKFNKNVQDWGKHSQIMKVAVLVMQNERYHGVKIDVLREMKGQIQIKVEYYYGYRNHLRIHNYL